MKNHSQIFTPRPSKEKHIGRIRFLSTALSFKKQSSKLSKAFPLSKSKFSDIAKYGALKEKNPSYDLKFQRETQNSSSLSPKGKNLKNGIFKLCNSKNVCVFSNLKQYEDKCEFEQKIKILGNQRKTLYDKQRETNNFLNYESLSPRFKKLKNMESSKTRACMFQLRKVSSSQNCRDNKNNDEKILDAWNIQHHGQDPDIIFYK